MTEWTILDGAMGTMLQAAGLGLGQRPELFGLEHPEVVEGIHRAYVEAGSRVLYTNTFGANAHKLEGTDHTVEEVISSAVSAARRAADGKARVALDIGPLGALLEPLGTLSFDEAYDLYAQMVRAGEQAGADLVIFETMSDLGEVRAAVLAAQEQSNLPIWVTMSFERTGRTFTGTTAASMAATLDALGVEALGVNCSLGPQELLPIVEELRRWTDKPLIVKPNAGLPDPATGQYEMDAVSFAQQMAAFPQLGATILGGCCGTSPDFIRALSQRSSTVEPKAAPQRLHGVCSASRMVELSGVRVIGERINPTGKKRFQQALREHDLNYIMERAIEQAEAGADILDINVGLPGLDEPSLMREVVQAVQSVVDLPLQIDSSDPAAIEAGLRACHGRAIVNSVNAEPEVLQRILPLVKRYGAAVVGLTMDKSGIPQTAEARLALGRRILDSAQSYGIPKEDVLLDCLTLTVSAQQEQARETLRAVRMVHEELGLHCVLGVSNISFGLPERSQITVSFLTQAMACGLDLPIVNPNQREIMDAIAAYKALSGEDRDCAAYIERFAQRPKTEPAAQTTTQLTLSAAVLKGLKQETAELTGKLLEEMGELEVINQHLIPALDVVGEQYERQEIFLPQLINAANAACAGFDLIKARIAARGGESVSKGKIVLATVEGDIHDIGKNIVRVVLENYGYQVIDLGRDVPVERVVEVAVAEQVQLVGLSALMTTTVESMRRTIEALRQSGHPCKVMVGGAVLTPEYAAEIGADYYAKDAKASADIAKEVLG
jgi:5-methyltetrahydrofolate--homocysteine methyltransferase